MSATEFSCPQCGTPLPSGVPADFCPICSCLDAADDTPDIILGDCELLEKIGQGGMGVVWKARQRALNRIVAVKTLSGGGFATSDARSRFRVEALASARLQHPHIVTVHDVGEHDGTPFLIMEMVNGHTLQDAVSEGAIAPRIAAEWMAHIADAIAHAHENGVMHRDIKPSNILLDEVNQPKITDFGLAKIDLSDASRSLLTLSGCVAGSPAYMAPEQARGERATPLCDIYSMGALVYHLLTGRAPFQGESMHTIMHQVQKDDPVNPLRLNPSVPRDLANICLKCLEKNPQHRYADAASLADDFRAFLEGRTVSARPVGRLMRGFRWARRNRWQAAALLLTFLLPLMIMGGLFQLFQKEKNHRVNLLEEQKATRNALAISEINGAHSLVALRRYGDRTQAINSMRSVLADEKVSPANKYHARNAMLHAMALDDISFQPLTPTRERHSDYTMISLAPDHTRWAQGIFPHQLRIINRETSNELFRFSTAPHKISVVLALSHHGNYIALRHEDHLGIWDLSNKKLIALPTIWRKQDTFSPTHFAFADDEKQAAFSSPDGKVGFISLPQGEITWWQDPNKRARAGINYSPDGKTVIITREDDPYVVMLDRHTHGIVQSLTDHEHQGYCAVAMNHSATRIAASSSTGDIVLWDLTNPRSTTIHLSKHTQTLRCLSFSPDDRWLTSSGIDSTVCLWEMPSGNCIMKVPADTCCIDFSPDSRWLGTALHDDTFGRWHIQPSPLLHSITPDTSSGSIQQISTDPMHDALAYCTSGGISIINTKGKFLLENFPSSGVGDLCWMKNEIPSLIISSHEGLNRLQLEQGKWLEQNILPPTRWVWTLSRTGTNVISTNRENNVVLLDSNRKKSSHTVPMAEIGHACIHPDGDRMLLVPSYSDHAHLMSIHSNKILREIPCAQRHGAYASEDGKWWCISGETTRLYRDEPWQEIQIHGLEKNNAPSGGAVFFPDHEHLAVVSGNSRVAIIRLSDAAILYELEAPDSPVINDLSITADSRYLYCAAAQGKILRWDMQHVKPLTSTSAIDPHP